MSPAGHHGAGPAGLGNQPQYTPKAKGDYGKAKLIPNGIKVKKNVRGALDQKLKRGEIHTQETEDPHWETIKNLHVLNLSNMYYFGRRLIFQYLLVC